MRRIPITLETSIQSFLRLDHLGDMRELFDELVPAKSSLDGDGRFARSRAAIFAFEQLDLLLQQVLRQFVTGGKEEKRNLVVSGDNTKMVETLGWT